MPNTLIKEQVDIFKLPSVDAQHKGAKGTQISIGDLHANTMKLIFMLIKHGVATNIDAKNYERLVTIYKTPTNELTKALLTEFNQILDKITFNTDTIVRLIGDELADRGSNDYFTLKVLEKLYQHKVPVETIVSNHGIEFIEAYEKQQDFHAPMLSQGGHAPSMEKLQQLVEKGLVDKKEIKHIANQAYKPTLRAISYSLSEDKQEITIYSHAGIGLESIKNLAKKLNAQYKDTTTTDLAQTIDRINEVFQQHVQANTVHTLYSREKMQAGYGGMTDLTDSPFEFILWNRFYHTLSRPTVHFGYRINFAHGHDSRDQTKDNIYNLDNNLGKFWMDHNNQGEYTVLYSQNQIAPAYQPATVVESVDTKVDSQNDLIRTPPALKEQFLIQLKSISRKADFLEQDGHKQAANCAHRLYETIHAHYDHWINKEITNQTFQTQCSQAIDTARPELEKHRGWKQLLGNLMLAIVGLGVFYVAAGLINKAVTGHFLFFKTDSQQKIDQLEHTLQSIPG